MENSKSLILLTHGQYKNAENSASYKPTTQCTIAELGVYIDAIQFMFTQ